MKRHNQSINIRSQKARQKKTEKIKRRRKKWKKGKNRFSQKKKSRSIKQPRRHSSTFKERIPQEVVRAPLDFSLINEHKAVLKFFDRIRILLRKRREVLLDFSLIRSVTPDAIALLLAKISDPKFHKHIRIYGNKPKNPLLDEIFFESGFYKIVGIDTREPSKGVIHTKKNIRVDRGIAVEARKLTSMKTFGCDKPLRPLYRTLIECMANTKKHAKGENIHDETWWLAVYHNSATKTTNFSFIDTGVGIFRSARVKKITKLAVQLGITSNTQILIDILQGKIESSTGLPYRGKGLPKIYSDFSKNHLHNLYIISNNVFANFGAGIFVELKIPLNGTFLYWEIMPDKIN